MAKDSRAKNSFDELVAGISAEERRFLLEKLKREGTDVSSQTFASLEETVPDTRTIQLRIQSSSLFYRFFLWLRSLFTNQSQETLYNKDRIAELAKKVNRAHPGIIDFSEGVLQSIFFEKLKELQTCADFFRPYISIVNENQGEFYVFLSTFVAPEITESINVEADPYTIPFERPLTNELRVSLTRKLDAAIRNISQNTKQKMYYAVRSIEWLKQFSALPFLHFIAQFTAIMSESHTCPFSNAQTDYPAFVRVLANGMPISNEVLHALFLFAQHKTAKVSIIDSNTERAAKDFFKRALSDFSVMQMFITTIPLVTLGKIIFSDVSWQGEAFGGAEDWSIKFRGQWKQIFDDRWNAWLRDKKKHQLVDVLRANFGLTEFPELPYRPWASLWGGLKFHGEMTAGFLAWFNKYRYPDIIPVLNTLMLEGIFLKNENRTEFSEAVNEFSSVNQKIETFINSLSPRGSIGTAFEQVASEHMRSLHSQARIDSIIVTAESQVHEFEVAFCNQCRTIESVFHGIFDEVKDSKFDTLQNLMTLKGRENQEFRDKMREVRATLKNTQELLAEIEPLDLPRQSSSETAAS
ncbi:MAG: hypothetical protein IJR50_07835 [Treponema sp.]|nr:hypothetical protein [Treponema sp.]